MTNSAAYFQEYNQKPERKKYLAKKSQARYYQQKKGTEHNLLSKPAKRALLEKEKEHFRLTQELKLHQHNLDKPKTPLEEYEKQCLLKKIEIGQRKLDKCEGEMKELGEAYQTEKRELCKRLAYSKEDIPDAFLRNPEERIDPITRQLVIDHEDYSK
ncbi:7371_t:CDS:2 [Ambispora leptoticha]|uniref:7371_t:CDS:1 n=1 Tax=Ambispora leptoticha TaxID=144679 RepID=A0A9N9GK64_9GLOM|nr:7371_t:CDS:2 [Ambispora leptoticha]